MHRFVITVMIANQASSVIKNLFIGYYKLWQPSQIEIYLLQIGIIFTVGAQQLLISYLRKTNGSV